MGIKSLLRCCYPTKRTESTAELNPSKEVKMTTFQRTYSLKDLKKDMMGTEFPAYLKSIYAIENLDFYKALSDVENGKITITDLIKNFKLDSKAPDVNLSSELFNELKDENNKDIKTTITKVKESIEDLLLRDNYLKFINESNKQ